MIETILNQEYLLIIMTLLIASFICLVNGFNGKTRKAIIQLWCAIILIIASFTYAHLYNPNFINKTPYKIEYKNK
jgi:uncharacterized membrane protein YjjP (DUF1212 family)